MAGYAWPGFLMAEKVGAGYRLVMRPRSIFYVRLATNLGRQLAASGNAYKS